MNTISSQIGNKSNLTADICIIGAGPAGLAIANELNQSNLHVILLESGPKPDDIAGLRNHSMQGHATEIWSPDAFQQLNMDDQLPTGDISYPNASLTRCRKFGGTSNLWGLQYSGNLTGVRYTTLDAIDFESRHWVPYSGWPFDKAYLDPYYQRAHAFAKTGPYVYDPEYWKTDNCKPYPFADSGLETKMFHFGPSKTYLSDAFQTLEDSPNVQLITEATATALVSNDYGSAVKQVHVKSLSGAAFTIDARVVVIATGTIEATRLLLCSREINPIGLGNQNDLVGRFLMDHQMVRSGLLHLSTPDVLSRLTFYDSRFMDGAMVLAKPVLTAATLRQKHLLNTCATLLPRFKGESVNRLRTFFPKGPRHNSASVEASVNLKRALRARKLGKEQAIQLGKSLMGIPDILYYRWRKNYGFYARDAKYHLDKGGWSEDMREITRFPALEVIHLTEQVPDPENRITLGTQLDELGMPRIRQHWRLTDTDLRGVAGALQVYKDGFAKAGIGSLALELNQGAPQIMYSSLHHPMGTTRMHDDPKRGVVDSRCRIHGTANCYVASASVFPTGGYANSTLTVLALAIRIADDVKRVCRSA